MSSSRGKLAGFSLPVPNQTRLQELYALAQRKQAALPGPGEYQVNRPSSSGCSHRRPHQPQLDGPFLLAPGQPSLRCQQINSLLLLRDSGQAPGAYDGPASKDATSCLARAPTPKFGSSSRSGTSLVSAEQRCLSLSRSISSGLYWARPVPMGQLQQHLGSPCGAVAAAACKAVSSSGSHVAAGTAEPCSILGSRQLCTEVGQQQPQQVGPATAAAAAAACSPVPGSSSLLADRGARAAGRHALPGQLAKSIAEWEHVAQALKQQLQQQEQQQQPTSTQLHKQCQEEPAAQAAQRCSCSVIRLQQQVMLQHASAARAAATAELLAGRRQKWQQLSSAP